MLFQFPVPEDGDYTGQVLWMSVWSWNRFSKADFLGEVMLPLWTMDLHDKTTKSYQLQPVSVNSINLSIINVVV